MTLILPRYVYLTIIFVFHMNICDVFHRVSFSIFTSLSLCMSFCGLERKLELSSAIPVHSGAKLFLNLHSNLYSFSHDLKIM